MIITAYPRSPGLSFLVLNFTFGSDMSERIAELLGPAKSPEKARRGSWADRSKAGSGGNAPGSWHAFPHHLGDLESSFSQGETVDLVDGHVNVRRIIFASPCRVRVPGCLDDYFAWATTTTMAGYQESADDVPRRPERDGHGTDCGQVIRLVHRSSMRLRT
jgi:hypothetical protein